MAVTDYIPLEKLNEEGFIDSRNKSMVIEAFCKHIDPEARLPIGVIAKLLKSKKGHITVPRLRRFLKYNHSGITLDKDQCLSLNQIMAIDWNELTGKQRSYLSI